ncbi:hypothetical protein I547_7709 [Mycobacterium kansasii 824]|nr:hypothetical protein I547_7709 [Mycobacterium kansasii 824]
MRGLTPPPMQVDLAIPASPIGFRGRGVRVTALGRSVAVRHA